MAAPLVASAGELAARLVGARRMARRYGNFTHSAEPPCHALIGSMASLLFGEDPLHRGALQVWCRSCSGSPGFWHRLELLLGCRIQRWLGQFDAYLYPDSDFTPPAGPLELNFLPAVDSSSGPAPLGGLRDLECWIPARNKRCCSYWTGSGSSRLLVSWRQSRPEGVALARYGGGALFDAGGSAARLEIRPWRNYDRAAAQAGIVGRFFPGAGGLPAAPGLCLAGDAATPADLDWFVLDLDYKPDRASAPWLGLRARNRLLERAAELGCPTYLSSSGRGGHVLGRLAADYVADRGRNMQLAPAGNGSVSGFLVDRFLPGAKALVCVRFDQPWANVELDRPAPVFSGAELAELLALD